MPSHVKGLPLRPLLWMGGVILFLNLAGWSVLFGLRTIDVTVVGIGLLAFAFGLRHAFDADHIAAIDNVTRKLRQEGQKPVGVGFFFSLGHSTVVLLLSVLIVFLVRQAGEEGSWFREWGGVFSAVVSAGFLTLIGLINLVIFRHLFRAFRKARRAGPQAGNPETGLDAMLEERGFFNRIFRGVNKRIDKSWKMFYLGFLFGFGFDTATEIAVLGISATAAQNGVLPLWGVMVFPVLFAAGMTLLDTLDGVLMLKAYDWAMADAMRKLYFNLVITGLSVLVALGIAGLGWLRLLAEQAGLHGLFWDGMESLDPARVGMGVVGMMLLAWAVAWGYYRRALRERKETVPE